MTVSSSSARDVYNGNGSTTAFTYNFQITDEDHIQVTKVSAAGVETVQTITTHYTVSGVGSASGTVTMLTAPASGEKLVLTRNVPFSQEVDYVENDPFPAETHESALDLAVMRDQQLNALLGLCLRLPLSSTLGSIVFPDGSANKLIGWNSAGTALENKDGFDAVLAAASASASAASSSASAASGSASAAASSASAASGSASTASTHATNASNSATAAAASATAAAASVASLNLPAIGGSDGLKHLRVNSGSTAYELAAEALDPYAALIDQTLDVTYSLGRVPYDFTVVETYAKSASGTCTATFKINGSAVGGSAHSVTSTAVTTTRSTSNTGSKGDELSVTVSASATCLNAYLAAHLRPRT